jgi:hypothetical protein
MKGRQMRKIWKKKQIKPFYFADILLFMQSVEIFPFYQSPCLCGIADPGANWEKNEIRVLKKGRSKIWNAPR